MRSKLINLLVPGMIPSKAIQEDFHAVRGHFLMLENFALVLQAARQLNCRLVNMSPMDLVKGNVCCGLVERVMCRRICCTHCSGRL